jgi:cardiolipin synthase
MEGVIGSSVQTGHWVQTLVNGNEIFPAMLEAIQGARNTVNLETYIYWSGDIADRFAEALSRKAKEGVRCHVLIDGIGGLKMRPELIETMKSAGVDVHIFRPVQWYTLDRVNNRTHRKVLVVDGRIGFTGGVGIADEWNGDARTPKEWRDNHYRVEGPAVAGLQSAFVENWLEATNEVLVGPDYFPQIEPTGKMAVQTVKSSSFSGSENVHLMLMLALAGATDHVRIAMAYFVPDEVSTAQLIEARHRGVDVDVMLPGEHIDSAAARSASRYHWGPLLEAGVRIWEFEPTMFHVKYVVVDDIWTTVGSANFDERAFSLNDEANISVLDRGFAKTHIDMFERDRVRSREVTLDTWKNRPVLEKAQDAFWGMLSEQM